MSTQLGLFSGDSAMQGQITQPQKIRGDSTPQRLTTSHSEAKTNLPDVSPEALEKARLARMAAKAARDASPLRRDFLDAVEWDELARLAGVRLPPWGQALTPTRMVTFLHRVKWPLEYYYAWSGESDRVTFARQNPDWPARAWAGIVLEEVVRQRGLS